MIDVMGPSDNAEVGEQGKEDVDDEFDIELEAQAV